MLFLKGILGLGFKDLSMGDHFNIVDDLNDNNQLPTGTFAVYLTDDFNSEITFGVPIFILHPPWSQK